MVYCSKWNHMRDHINSIVSSIAHWGGESKPLCKIGTLELLSFDQSYGHDPVLADQLEDSCNNLLTSFTQKIHTRQTTRPPQHNRKKDSPVTIIEDDNICSGKIDTKSSSSSWQEENKFLTSWFIKGLNWSIPIFSTSISINSTIQVSTKH